MRLLVGLLKAVGSKALTTKDGIYQVLPFSLFQISGFCLLVLSTHSSFSSNLHSWKIANTVKLCLCILHQGCWAATNQYLEVAMGMIIMCLQGMIYCAQEFALKAVHVSIIAHVLTEAKLLIFFLCSPTDFGRSDHHSYTSHGTCLWTLPCGCEIRFHLLKFQRAAYRCCRWWTRWIQQLNCKVFHNVVNIFYWLFFWSKSTMST